ncbi:unnamed protein product, partial [Vitis vinifera]|uniref:Uncharacterized protein n=1 Tax=Vitis vinifera TaxID=29760 RepID=D7SVX2_VITVI
MSKITSPFLFLTFAHYPWLPITPKKPHQLPTVHVSLMHKNHACIVILVSFTTRGYPSHPRCLTSCPLLMSHSCIRTMHVIATLISPPSRPPNPLIPIPLFKSSSIITSKPIPILVSLSFTAIATTRFIPIPIFTLPISPHTYTSIHHFTTSSVQTRSPSPMHGNLISLHF